MDENRINSGGEPVRNEKGQFLPDNKANLDGRPKGSKNKFSLAKLEEAIETQEKITKENGGVSLFEQYVKMAQVNPVVMISLMGKFVANKEKIEHSTDGPLEISIKRADAEDRS